MPISRSNKAEIIMTMGDPSGIGPEVILKSLANPKLKRFAKDFLIIGDSHTLKKTEKSLGIKSLSGLNIIDLKSVPRKDFKSGKVTRAAGKASMEYLKKALLLIKKGKAKALVTGPINKEAINKAGFHYSGHTEFLSKMTGSPNVAMMLMGGPFRVTLFTRHVALRGVAQRINEKELVNAIGLSYRFLQSYLGKQGPSLAVASLNPHGGEGGILGQEEIKVIAPSVIKAKKRYKGVYGPVPPDALFYDAYRKGIDGIVCMYHDQGMIPLKMIARDEGVNVTLGLSFVRTSPAHGTAFDIAGKGIANPSSMTEAIIAAFRLIGKDVNKK